MEIFDVDAMDIDDAPREAFNENSGEPGYVNYDRDFLEPGPTKAQSVEIDRLNRLRSACLDSMRLQALSAETVVAEEISKIPFGVTCVVVGAVSRVAKIQPSLLRKMTKDFVDNALSVEEIQDRISEAVFLEDVSSKIALDLSLAHELAVIPSGVVVALSGIALSTEYFRVEAYAFANFPPQRPLILSGEGPPRTMAIVSGLNFETPEANPVHRDRLLQLLMSTQTVERVILLGTSIYTKEKRKVGDFASRYHPEEQAILFRGLKSLDSFISDLASRSIVVHVVPGAHDPTAFGDLQPALSNQFFPMSTAIGKLHLHSNPSRFGVGGTRFLASSGNILQQFGDEKQFHSAPKAISAILRWRHLLPSATSSWLNADDFHRDPFVLEDTPHVVIVGNHRKFETDLLLGDSGQSLRAIAVPTFSKNPVVALLDLRTLGCTSMNFTS